MKNEFDRSRSAVRKSILKSNNAAKQARYQEYLTAKALRLANPNAVDVSDCSCSSTRQRDGFAITEQTAMSSIDSNQGRYGNI